MLVYRIASEPFAADLSGEGARLYGGRWNPCGIPVLYTSESVALAALELLVNVPPDFLGLGVFSRITIHVPDDVIIHLLETATLPAEWRAYPAPPDLAERGRIWFRTASASTTAEYFVLSFFSSSSAAMVEETGRLSPIASIADDIVLAVYIPPQDPAPGQE